MIRTSDILVSPVAESNPNILPDFMMPVQSGGSAALRRAIRTLDRFSTSMTLGPGQRLFSELEPSSNVYLIQDGFIRLFTETAERGRVIVDFLLPGDVIGALPQRRHVYTAETMTVAVVRRYPRIQVERLMPEDGDCGSVLLDLAWEQEEDICRFHASMGRKKPRQRLAAFLLRIAQRSQAGMGQAFQLPASDDDIGRHLGLVSEAVHRGLAELEARRVIARPYPGVYKILDREELVSLSAARHSVHSA